MMTEVSALQINPGGRLDTRDVAGRNDTDAGVAYDFRWQLVKRWWKERRP